MKDIIKTSEIETYAVFINLDKSILGLNPFLANYGYSFKSFNLQELESDFSDLFSLPKKFESEMTVEFEGKDISISNEFYQAVTNSVFFGTGFLFDTEFIFLKRTENFKQRIKNEHIKIDINSKVSIEFQKMISSLTQQLRLFKNGDVASTIEFQIDKNTRKVRRKLYGSNFNSKLEKMDISAKELLEFQKHFTIDFQVNELTNLALTNFNLSYKINDVKTKYITLMTCLESLFNHGRAQITHTVSRHLALIISNSPDEFKKNYYRTKQLYGLRSAIVHGSRPKEDIKLATIELQNIVRKAINYCLKLNYSKKELFDKLNSSGY